MKLREIFRFELAYQLRRPWPWLAFAVMVVFAFENIRAGVLPVTLPQDFILNSPFVITSITVFSCLIWLLVASPLAGEAAARDLQTGMHPLTYTMPVSRREYLGGRFLAGFVLNLFVLFGVQLGCILGVYLGGVDPAIIGPFRIAAHLAAFAFIAIPNAFVATTIQFSFALISGRAMAAYFGSVVLVFLTVPVPFIVYFALGKPAVAKMLDPIGLIAIMNEMMSEWTIVEKNVRMFTLHGPMLWNRLLWVTIAAAALVLMHARFRFAHRTVADSFTRMVDRFGRRPVVRDAMAARKEAVAVPAVRQQFGFATKLQQTLSIGWSSLWMILKSPAGIFMLVVFPALLVLVTYVESEQWGIPLIPRTGYILTKHLVAPITYASDYRLMIPLLIIFFAGELVWRERDAGLSENVDATSVPDGVLLLGKFIGLGLVLSAYMIALMIVGMITQVLMGYFDFEIGLYLQILFGFQLPEYLLFAMLALMIQVVVNQKYVALLVTLVVYCLIIFSGYIGIDHNLAVYGASPGWSHTDMRGFVGAGPWLWFKLYWAAWALLLGLAARLWWVRGRESGLGTRTRMARRRFAGRTAAATALAAVLIVTLGGFIFYNTNILNEFITDDELVQRRADYERLYGKYEGIPQPTVTATKLNIDIQPKDGEARITGSYRLVNRDVVPIETVHLEPAFYVDTRMTFDRPARVVVADQKVGHHIYALEQPLQPGDSVTLNFDVKIGRPGFRNAGVRASGASHDILANGSYFTNGALPTIGYSPMRELWSADDRRKQGLPRQVTVPTPSDAGEGFGAAPTSTFEAVVATDANQIGVAPGELRRRWTDGGRQYFHYVSDVPVGGMHVFFSADYQVHREQRNGVDVQIYVHPAHAKHVDRLLRGVRAALDYNSEQFGTYPYRFLQVVEQPGNFLGMGVDGGGVITGGEGFFLLDPKHDGFDAIFEVVAHEMGHQWWAVQLRPAIAEGGGVISEGLAWYSAMQLVKNEKGREALRRFMSTMRQPSPWPPIRTGHPLLRAIDPWANYRKAPYAFYALSEYIGEDGVNGALKTLVEKKRNSLATTLDMYREFQAVTPDSLKPLLRDLFEVNAWWKFDTRKSTARALPDGKWEVTFELEAKKTVTDSAGVEKDALINEPIEIGVFAAAESGQILGKPLYVQKHRIRAGTQTVKIVVPAKPARGGIDPYNLLDWEEGDNIEEIEIIEQSS